MSPIPVSMRCGHGGKTKDQTGKFSEPAGEKVALHLRHSGLGLEFGTKASNAFGAGVWHPAKSRAKKFVLLPTFQAEADGFLVELMKFLRRLHPFSQSLGQSVALASLDTRPM